MGTYERIGIKLDKADKRAKRKSIKGYAGSGARYAWAQAVKTRDGWKCLVCKTTEAVVAHHLLPRAKYKNVDCELWNGVTLCKVHHRAQHPELPDILFR